MQKISALMALLLLPTGGIAREDKTGLASSGASELMCGVTTYHDGLTLGFQKAAGVDGETLVTMQVLPSFQREYAIMLKRTASGLRLLRASFRKQLWTQLGPPLSVARTRQQCLEIASAAEMDTVPVPVSAEQENSLWATFSNTNLQTDICARRKRQCALIHDGTQYVIQLPDGRSFRLTELEGMKGIVSENAALLDWVHTVLRVAQQWQEPPLSP